jgi:O-antigen/teichoic acid export membrane protein
MSAARVSPGWDRLRQLKSNSTNSFWAVADQAASSLGNFVTNVMLARAMAREDYGTFGLILELIFFLNAIQSALIAYPLSVRAATSDSRHLSAYATASLLLTMLLASPVIIVAMLAGAVSGHLVIAACASLALLLWQLQETLRRSMLAHLRYRQAVWGDAVSYLGQAACVIGLIGLHRLSIEAVFGVIALTSAVAGMIQLVQVGLCRVGLRELLHRGRDFLVYGRYLAVNNTTAIFSTLAYSWVLTWCGGRTAVAELFAILTLLKLTSPVINLIASLIVPAAARANARDGPHAAARVAARYTLLGAALLLPYFVLLIVVPGHVIALFYGAGSTYADDANALRMYVAVAALTYAASTMAAFFNAIHQSRLSMIAQVVNAAVSAALGLPLAVAGGVFAAAAGTVIAVASQLAVLLHFHARLQRRRPDPETGVRRSIRIEPSPLPAAA